MAMNQEELTAAQVEKRQYRRAKLIAQVQCVALNRESLTVTRDVSVGGMFLNERDPFPAHSIVNLSFCLKPGGAQMTCRGEVAYAIKGVGMGVRFRDLPEDVRAAIEQFVAEAS
jgi:c-di-GMP-binding flagellar brake protein YcgR